MTIHEVAPHLPLPSASSVKPGDTILLHGGRYAPVILPYAGTERDPITVTNAPGEYVEVSNPVTPPGEKMPLLVWLARGSAHIVLEENPSGGELLLRHDPPTRTESDLAFGFRVTGDHCEVRNVRVTGALLNGVDRVLGGAVSGLVCWRWGVDSPVRGSAYAVYYQADGRSRALITDGLFSLGHSSAIHVFGSQRAARDILISRCYAVGSGAISQHEEMKPLIVVDEEDPTGRCSGIEIRECVAGNPYHYGGEAAGMGGASLQLGGFRSPPNGSVVVADCDLFGAISVPEPWAWVEIRDNWIMHRPGQTGSDGVPLVGGISGRKNMLNSLEERNTIALAPGYPEPFPPGLTPRVRVWQNRSELGRAHVIVSAFQGERSITVDLRGIVEPKKNYQVVEVARGHVAHFTAGDSPLVELELPDIDPHGLRPGRNPHPVSFAFLIRKAA